MVSRRKSGAHEVRHATEQGEERCLLVLRPADAWWRSRRESWQGGELLAFLMLQRNTAVCQRNRGVEEEHGDVVQAETDPTPLASGFSSFSEPHPWSSLPIPHRHDVARTGTLGAASWFTVCCGR